MVEDRKGIKLMVKTDDMGFPVNRSSRAAGDLMTLMAELGLSAYGRLDEDLAHKMRYSAHITHIVNTVLNETVRGVDLVDPVDGALLMRTRAYWWGDCDTSEDRAEMDAPNLEVPSLGFALEWYKYALRDSYTSMPLTDGLIEDIRSIMRPVLDLLWPFVPHPQDVPLEWTDYESPRKMTIHGDDYHVVSSCVAKDRSIIPKTSYDHGIITMDENGYTWNKECEAFMFSNDETFITSCCFDEGRIADAKAWCERAARFMK